MIGKLDDILLIGFSLVFFEVLLCLSLVLMNPFPSTHHFYWVSPNTDVESTFDPSNEGNSKNLYHAAMPTLKQGLKQSHNQIRCSNNNP